MAQNALTVTPPNPTPPTNFVNTGATPPNPATYDPLVYHTAGDVHYPQTPTTAPFYDDGTAGSLTAFAAKKAALAVGGTSVDHEGLGTEAVVTAPGSSANAPTQSVSSGPNATQATRDAGPNASHASTLSGTAVPTLSAASGASNVSGAGTTLLTVTGTNYNRGSIITLNGVPQQTNYVSATSLTVTNAQKRATAGTLPVTVTSNGITTAPVNWTLT